MARTYKQPSVVSGLTVEQILNMDEKVFDQLTLSDLKKITGRLVSAGNKRLRTIEKSGKTTPASRAVMESGGEFSVKGKDKTALKNEFQRAKTFFERKTSTIRGYKEVKKQIIEELKKPEKGNINLSEKDFDRVLTAFDLLKQNSKKMNDRKFRYRVLKIIRDVARDNPQMTADDLKEKIFSELDTIYEEHQKTTKAADVSSFFEVK